MFRKINLKNEDEDFRAELYRNRHEKIADIPNDYIGTVKRSLDSIDEFTLTIPKYNQVKNKKNINPIYTKIKPMQHVIVKTMMNGVEKKERFILIEPKGSRSKYTAEKTFKAMSFEYTLKKKRTSFEGKVIQLKKDDVHIAEGILDKFERETGWGIEYVDPKSRVELMSTTEKVNVDLFNNYSKTSNVAEGGLLFEKNITTTIADNRPLYISFEYSNFKTYDGEKLLIETPSIYNTITDALYTNIKKVQAYHYSDVGNRYGIRYVFTLADNTTTERIAVFTNVINKTFTCENIRLVWETGNIIETENVKYINIESLDTDWYEALISLQDNFKSVFLFNSYDKKVSVIHRDNLGEEKPYVLTYDNAIIDIEVTENSEYITGLKVMGKDGLSIVSENIYGDDIVRNYSEYIRLGNMSEELQSALERYESILTTKQQEWLGIKDSVITETQKKVRIDSEIQSLQTRIKELKNLLAGYMTEKDGSNQARIKAEIDGLETRLNQCLALRIGYNQNTELLNDELSAISKAIDRNIVVDSVGKIFTENNLKELNDIEQFAVYEDDYYSNSFSLLNACKKILEDMIKPQIDFDINCINLCKVIQNKKGWKYILEIGSLFKFEEGELREELGDDTVRFVGYEYEPKTNTISNLVFTNKTYRYDVTRKLADLGRKNNATSNILNSLRPIIDDAMLSNNFVGEVLKNGLDMSAYVARGRSISNYIEFNEAGLFMYDQSDMNKAIYIGSSLICITNDKFASSETAISSDGILAKLLVGSVILGEKLYISSELGDFYIGNMDDNKQSFGLSIRDGLVEGQTQRIFLGTEIVNGVRKAVLRLIGKNGELALSEDGILTELQFNDGDNVDLNAPLVSHLRLRDNMSTIKDAILTISLLPFRVYSKGLESAGYTKTTFTSKNGGGSTSGGGGSYSNSTSTTSTASYAGQYYGGVRGYLGVTSDALPTYDDFGTPLPITAEYHLHETYDSYGHVHGVTYSIEIPDHTHTTPDHSHQTEISIDSHKHEEVYGCFDTDKLPSDISVKVNGTTVITGINVNTEIDIARYLIKNQVNVIEVTTKTIGQIRVNLSVQYFKNW